MNEWYIIPAFFCVWFIVKLRTEEGFFVPLPMATVHAMLRLARVRGGDTLYDLGSGDGRTVIEAAKLGAHAIGIEYSIPIYWLSRLRVMLAGTWGVEILRKDFFRMKLTDADVVTFYLTPKLASMLGPKLKRELRKGARVVSAAHEIPRWPLKRKIRTGHFWSYLYVR